jgi:hypothetical protein
MWLPAALFVPQEFRAKVALQLAPPSELAANIRS